MPSTRPWSRGQSKGAIPELGRRRPQCLGISVGDPKARLAELAFRLGNRMVGADRRAHAYFSDPDGTLFGVMEPASG